MQPLLDDLDCVGWIICTPACHQHTYGTANIFQYLSNVLLWWCESVCDGKLPPYITLHYICRQFCPRLLVASSLYHSDHKVPSTLSTLLLHGVSCCSALQDLRQLYYAHIHTFTHTFTAYPQRPLELLSCWCYTSSTSHKLHCIVAFSFPREARFHRSMFSRRTEKSCFSWHTEQQYWRSCITEVQNFFFHKQKVPDCVSGAHTRVNSILVLLMNMFNSFGFSAACF